MLFSNAKNAQAYHATSSYNKTFNDTLTSQNWNDLFSDFVNTWLPVSLNGPVGIATGAPAAGLSVNGPVNATNLFTGGLFTTGNVGVGTTNPGSNLHIVGSLDASGTVNGTGLCIAGVCKTDWSGVGATSGWTINGTTVYKTDTNGNVGVGTTNPAATLNLERSNAAGAPSLRLSLSDSPASYRVDLKAQYDDVTSLALQQSGQNILTAGRSPSKTALYTFNGGGTSNERITILGSSGNVGIGTTNPVQKLAIANGRLLVDNYNTYSEGSIQNNLAEFTLRTTNGPNYSSVYSYQTIDSSNGGSNNAQANWLLAVNNATAGDYQLGGLSLYPANYWTASKRGLYVYSTNVPIKFATGIGAQSSKLYGADDANVKMTIDNNGRVGIGTTNPGNQLTVNGRGGFNNDQVTIGGTSGLAAERIYLNYDGANTLGRLNAISGVGLSFGSNGANDRLVITSGGNIGIGTTAPGSNLDVVGSINASGTVNGTGLCIGGDCKVSWPAIIAAGGGNLWSGTTTGAIWNANSGDVGIGTTAPGARIEIKGSGNTFATTNFRLANSDNTTIFTVQDHSVGKFTGQFQILGGTGTNQLYVQDGGAYIAGNVGIGTSTPTQQLAVGGNGNIWLAGSNPGIFLMDTPSADGYGYRIYNDGDSIVGNLVTNAGAGATQIFDFKYGNPSVYSFTGNTVRFGIGTSTPTANLEIYQYSSDADLLKLSSAGGSSGDLLTVRNSGNVGIMKSSPGANLDVVGSINASGTVNGTGLCIGGDCRTSWAAAGAYWTGYGSDIASNNSGNVGVGTTAPSQKLHVAGGAYITQRTGIGVTPGGHGSILSAQLDGSNGQRGVVVFNNTGDTDNDQQLFAGLNHSGNFTSWINGAGSAYFGGNVGIGTTAPSNRLHTVGFGSYPGNLSEIPQYSHIRFQPRSDQNGSLFIAGNSDSSTLIIQGALDGTTARAISLNPYGGNVGVGVMTPAAKLQVAGGQLYLSGKGSATGLTFTNHSIYQDANNILILDSSGNQNMAFMPGTGNIGIAKTNPSSNLDVVGSINASGTVNGTGLCIGGDCKVSWPAIIAAGGGNLWSGTTTGAIWNANSGDVGIGTTAPGARIEIKGSGNTFATTNFRLANSDNTTIFTVQDHSVGKFTGQFQILGGTGTNQLYVQDGGAYIAGNVGIGTSTPTQQLAVGGNGNIWLAGSNPGIFLMDTPSADGYGYRIYNDGDSIVGNLVTNAGAGATQIFDFKYGNPSVYSFTGNTVRFGIGTSTPTANLEIYQYSSDADLLKLSSAGGSSGDLLTVRNSGNVGIMKSSPGANLDVVGSINASGTVNGTGLCIGGDCRTSWAAAGAYWTGYGSDIASNNSGNVGVGTTAPSQKLHVAGGAYITQRTGIGVTPGGHGSILSAQLDGSNGQRGVVVFNNTGDTDNDQQLFAGLNHSGNFTSWINGAGSAYFGGNVGIGTTAPSNRLHTVGFGSYPGNLSEIPQYSHIRFQPRSDQNGSLFIAGNSDSSTLIIQGALDGTTARAISLNPYGGNVGVGVMTPAAKLQVAGGQLYLSGKGSATGLTFTNHSIYQDANNILILDSSGNQNMAFMPGTGNIGIAKTNPSSNLDVVGSINASGTVNGTGLCIGGDCKVSWPAIIAAGGGNLWSGTTTGAIWNANSGNVGIGTTNPLSKFEIYGGNLNIRNNDNGINVLGLGLATSDSGAPGGAYGTSFIVGNSSTGSGHPSSLAFYTESSGAVGERVRIDSIGNVGIGTTSPAGKLEVSGTAIINNTLTLNGAGSAIEQIWKGGTWYHIKANASNLFNIFEDNYETTRNIALVAGNVGVGTTAPSSKLQVGATTGSNFITLAGGVTGASYGIDWSFNNPGVNKYAQVMFSYDDRSTKGLQFNINNGYQMSFNRIDTVGTFQANLMTILSAGNVGIAKTNPGTTLDVTGGINASGTVNGTGLCIGGDCKVSWPSIVSAGGGNLWSGTTTSAIWNANIGYNVGIGTTNPQATLQVAGGLSLNRTTVADADYTTQSTDYIIGYTTLTTNRTVTLPNALCTPGRFFVVLDESGSASASKKIIIDPEGATTIVGQPTFTLSGAYNSVYVFCGSSAWYVL
ncbi:MAG: hypothetical protein WC453_00900 [Patescibacteria group bacterium]